VPNQVRWNWRSVKPQAPYLTFLAIGQYEVRVADAPNGQELITAYGDDLGDNRPAARASVERTPEVIETLEQFFGPYPFEAQGGIVDSGLGFALENQTRPVYDGGFFFRGSNTSVVAHELAHQWFGDSVSVRDWREIWLNEGFASYAEYLWSDVQGEGTPAELAQFVYDAIPADDEFWQVKPGDPGAGANQFHDAVYDRGAMTLQALRTAVGDDAFFTILRRWPAAHKYDTATTAQFIALAERISGQQLDDLFNTWLYTVGKPAVGPNGATAAARTAQVKPKSFDQIERTHELLAATGSR
jgi:aminopeptidase N